MKAIWNGAVLAQTDKTEVVEGNHYFPPNAHASRVFPRERYAHCVWLEGHGKLLHDRRERPGKQRRGLVLSGTPAGRKKHCLVRSLLERGGNPQWLIDRSCGLRCLVQLAREFRPRGPRSPHGMSLTEAAWFGSATSRNTPTRICTANTTLRRMSETKVSHRHSCPGSRCGICPVDRTP